MEALPASAFEVPEAEFLLELLVVALDAPAQLGQIDQARQGNVVGKGGEPILRRLLLGFRPFDQQPLFLTGSAAAGRGLSIAWAAAAWWRAPTPKCSTECRRHRSGPAR